MSIVLYGPKLESLFKSANGFFECFGASSSVIYSKKRVS
jgi:hypothetical protein